MRTALLTATDTAELGGEAGPPSSFQRFAGHSILQHQVEFALQSGCQSIIILTNTSAAEIDEAIDLAKDRGAVCKAIRSPRRLSALVRARDTLLVLQEGFLVQRAHIAPALGERDVILAFPAEHAVGRGYERINVALAWAGVMQIRAELVEHLHNLPADIDTTSALLRIALQAQTKVHPLALELMPTAIGPFDPDTNCRLSEQKWLRKRTDFVGFGAPLKAVIERAAFRLASKRFSEWRTTRWVEGAAFAMLALALPVGWMADIFLSLTLVFLAAIAFVAANLFKRLSLEDRRSPGSDLIQDGAPWLVITIIIGFAQNSLAAEYFDIYIAATMVAAIFLARASELQGFAAFAGDNVTLTALLAISAAFDVSLPLSAIGTLLFFMVLLFEKGRTRLTTN